MPQYGPRDFPEDHAEWLDDIAEARTLFGQPLEQLVEFSELGMGGPETWDSFNLDLDSSGQFVDISITAGMEEFSVRVDVDLEDFEQWDWAWDLYDWIEDNYPDVDLEVQYDEK